MTLSFGTVKWWCNAKVHQYAQEGPTHSAPALPKVCAAAARRAWRERHPPRQQRRVTGRDASCTRQRVASTRALPPTRSPLQRASVVVVYPRLAARSMSAEQRRPVPLRPALQHAARALCEAATPAAAREAAGALDVQCSLAFQRFEAPAGMTLGKIERDAPALADALAGVSISTLEALLRSRQLNHVCLAAKLLWVWSNPPPHVSIPDVKAVLGSGRVFNAVLDGVLAVEGPVLRAIADAGGEHAAGGMPSVALDGLLTVLVDTFSLRSRGPRIMKRFIDASQRDGVMRCLSRLYKPLSRRADGGGSLAALHSVATSVLQSLTSQAGGAALLWTMKNTVHDLMASVVAQVRTLPLASSQPIALACLAPALADR